VAQTLRDINSNTSNALLSFNITHQTPTKTIWKVPYVNFKVLQDTAVQQQI
jgi:hypothetical protein